MVTPDSGAMTLDQEAREREAAVRDALEDMARSLHAGYMQRWGRHDPAGLERAATQPDRDTSAA